MFGMRSVTRNASAQMNAAVANVNPKFDVSVAVFCASSLPEYESVPSCWMESRDLAKPDAIKAPANVDPPAPPIERRTSNAPVPAPRPEEGSVGQEGGKKG